MLATAVLAGVSIGRIIEHHKQGSIIKSQVQFVPQMGADKLSQTIGLVSAMYVDPVSVDSLVELAIPVLMEELDPHSVYIPSHEMQQANENIEGEFDGIGVVFNMATDTIIVMNVVPKGPSD